MNSKLHCGALSKPVAIALLLVLILGCTAESERDLVARAKQHFEKNETKAAILNLKASLQEHPNQPSARLLLGKALLRDGDQVAAEVELRKAAQSTELVDEAVPLLAQTMLALGQGAKVVEEFGSRRLSASLAQASLHTTLAAAYVSSGQAAKGKAALNAAISLSPKFVPALILGARQRATEGDVIGALGIAEGILADEPGQAEAWNLKGDLLFFGQRHTGDAEMAYRKALQLDPGLLAARFSLISALEQSAKTSAAEEELVQLRKLAPQHPQTRYLEAQHAFYKGDYRAARNHISQLLRIAPKDPGVLQMAGAIEYRLTVWTQAETYLARALQISPDLAMARRLLISTYLQSGQLKKAVSLLDSTLARADSDPGLFPIAGEVYLQNGDIIRAEKYFAKALAMDPKDVGRRTALAMARVSSGRVSEGLVELQDIASTDKSTLPDLALVTLHLRQRDYNSALAAIEKIERKLPDKPVAANLRAQAYLGKGDVLAARQSLEQAIQMDPTFQQAIMALASLDLRERKPDAAKKRYEDLLLKSPKNVQVLLALAQLAEHSKDGKEKVLALLSKAIEADPFDIQARQMLVETLLRYHDPKQALIVAQNGVALAPDNPEHLYMLGRVQQMSGDLNQAMSTYNKLITLRPAAGNAYLRLAETQAAAKNSDGARATLRRSLDVNPEYVEAQRSLIAMDLGARRFADARKTALAVQARMPNNPEGYVLEGDIANVQREWEAAATAYRAALKRQMLPGIATKLHAVLNAGGKRGEAEAFVASWLKSQPKDTVLLLFLGEDALAKKDLVAAESHYLMVLQRNADEVVALNNLAWITGQLRKPGALQYAERAYRNAPNEPQLLDTLSTLLADEKSFARAIELQSRAIALQPSNSLLRLGLAKILIKAGDKSKAKAELEALSVLGTKFSAQREVAELLRTL